MTKLNPWSDISVESVLFIVDAEHKIEEKLLMQWVEETKAAASSLAKHTFVTVPIAHDPEDISTRDLQDALNIAPNAVVAPIRVFWKTRLDTVNERPNVRDLLRGNPRRPSARQARSLLRQDPSNAECILGTPATLADLTGRYENRRQLAEVDANLADFVAEQASLALEVAERRLRGSRYKVPRQVSKQVRASDRYKVGLQQIAGETGETEGRLRERALPYFKELIATPHNFWQDVTSAFNRWMMSLGYNNQLVVDEEKAKQYREIVRENASAVLWTHKTHMDGPTIQTVLFDQDFPPLHIMGGINMAFAGIGFLARRSGAIFIRRSFQDNPLYKLVLRSYLAYLIEKRFPLSWAFEGTRSRVGKLMPPRYGMFKYTMDAMMESEAEQLHIIPVAINYDLINDVKDYAAEQAGTSKRPESLSWFISYLRRMRQPLGRIYVDFGDPVVVNKDHFYDDPLALEKTAFRVGVEVNRVTPITVTGLMCLSLLNSSPRAQTIQEMLEGMNTIQEWARQRDIRMTDHFRRRNFDEMRKLVDYMINSDLISRYDGGPDVVYTIEEDQQMMASYYCNTIIHHFVPKAIAEMAMLAAASEEDDPLAAFWQEVDRLKDMFKFEFFYEPNDEFQEIVRRELCLFDPDWEASMAKHSYPAYLLSEKLNPLVAPGVLRTFLEAYRVVSDVFARLDESETLSEKQTVQAAMKYARQAYMQRLISSKASIGQILFKNGFKLLDSYQLVEPSAGVKAKRLQLSRELGILINRIERIRVFATPNELEE